MVAASKVKAGIDSVCNYDSKINHGYGHLAFA